MLKISNAKENWRDALGDLQDELDEGDIDTAAEILQRETLRALTIDSNVDYDTVYSQSVGAFVLVQSGSEAERREFGISLESGINKVRAWMAQQ